MCVSPPVSPAYLRYRTAVTIKLLESHKKTVGGFVPTFVSGKDVFVSLCPKEAD